MRLLIDGDGLIYRCGFAVEKTKYLLEVPVDKYEQYDSYKEVQARIKAIENGAGNIWSRKEVEPLENALALVNGALEAMPDGEREIWLSPGVGNFRERIATISKYKGNRDYANRPTFYKQITEFLLGRHHAKVTVGQEADDELGIRATALGNEAVIVSFDKDLDQIPGNHYNWVTKEAYSITPKQGSINFYTQVIAGDPVDNVPGIKGIGPAKALKLLEGTRNPVECWEAALEAYKASYGAEEGRDRAIETARLVYVRRKPEEIWEPPTRVGP